ncbi:hypothetical protein QVG61_03410 [Thiohalobacter sp. IOR34]|uniref:hypothetical protein n=1 Tax=Thiohalobacter sp. IOR34 TaxID=3057176 RepID=UPI0025B25462|nr:hypothetical protein [Thiohalobacter sp. IOR34]WJW76154.1 hypothetical protein QVG61_03410 [Thiohalobacter sp. IOR34]
MLRLLPLLALLLTAPASACDPREARFVAEVLASIQRWERLHLAKDPRINDDLDYRRYDVIKRKIHAGLFLNASDCNGITLLNNILEQRPSPRTLALLRSLLRAGADPNRADLDGLTPLLAFSRRLPDLRRAGAEPALLKETLQLLLEAGADPNRVIDDELLITALDGPLRIRDPELAGLLLPGMNADTLQMILERRETALGRAPAIRRLIEARLKALARPAAPAGNGDSPGEPAAADSRADEGPFIRTPAAAGKGTADGEEPFIQPTTGTKKKTDDPFIRPHGE